MGANALLVTQDPKVQLTLSSILAGLGIETETFTDVAAAKAALRRARFAAVLVDCDLAGAESLLDLQDSPSNRTAVSFAVSTPGSSKHSVKASFVLSKPLQRPLTHSTMRAASGLIFSCYRKGFRCQLVVPLSLASAGKEINAYSSNISMGGIAIQTPQALSPEEQFRIHLTLPSGLEIQTDAKVVWTDKQGRAALLFTDMRESGRRALQNWLDTKIQGQPTHHPLKVCPTVAKISGRVTQDS